MNRAAFLDRDGTINVDKDYLAQDRWMKDDLGTIFCGRLILLGYNYDKHKE